MEEIRVSAAEDKVTIYQDLIPQLESLVEGEENFIANAANISAALKQSLRHASWVGFYFLSGEELVLGPFQGKVACTRIKIGAGVCGTSFKDNKTLIVPNVYEFPGHIFCDADSKSEIVVPLVNDRTPFGVLDLDSMSYSSFDSVDSVNLAKVAEIVAECFSRRSQRVNGS